MQTYKQLHDLETRKLRYKRVVEQYPDMIPTIIDIGKTSHLNPFEMKKFAVCKHYTVSALKQTIYEKLKIEKQKVSLFLYCNNNMLTEQMTMLEVQNKYKDQQDGFLYLTYTEVEALG